MKPKKPFEEDEEEEEEDISINGLVIGDLQIQSKKPIKNPARVVAHLLKNKQIKSYLQFYDRKQAISSAPTYID